MLTLNLFELLDDKDKERDEESKSNKVKILNQSQTK